MFPFMLAILLPAACGGGGAQLDARVLELSLVYSAQGPTMAQMTGERGAATAGATVECRLASGEKPILGEATANEFGAFEMTLDHSAFPRRVPTADEFRSFNETVECRPAGGSWVNPLKQPVLQVG
jgi:hypothetical protein